MTIQLKVPPAGESITSVEIGKWLKAEGDAVHKDETVVLLDSEKATVELPAPESGTLTKILKRTGESANIGDAIGEIDERAAVAPPSPPAPQPSKTSPAPQPAASAPAPAPPPPPSEEAPEPAPHDASAVGGGDRTEQAVHMSLWRRTIAKRLVQAKRESALLTTFNEIDMSGVGDLRRTYGDAFKARHDIKLGLMSFFVKAAVDALRAFPQVNAEVRGEEIVYRNYCDIGVAVSTGKGLVVPVLRGADRLGFAAIEKAIADFARRSQAGALTPEELDGGTFSITNGGVFGSMMSTPIVNPPQSAILGLHAIQDRPVARGGQVVIRPMMYVALTYDHRIIDGREAVLFLVRVKETIETPARMLIEV